MSVEYLSSRQVRTRYSIAKITLARWIADPKLKFPKPEPIRKRHYWPVVELDRWDEARKQGEAA